MPQFGAAADGERDLALTALGEARAAWANDDQSRALSLAKLAAELDPELPTAWLCLVEMTTGTDRARYLERLLRVDPANSAARRYLSNGSSEQAASLGSPLASGQAESSARVDQRPRVRGADRAGYLALSIATLGAVLLIALGLRLVNLDEIGLNSDEAVYAGQAAAIAGDPELERFFSLFRAHPLLVHFTMAVPFAVFGVSDLLARASIAIPFGVGSVVLVYLLASRLYDRWMGGLAAAVVALMPYHVLVSRQVLLDAPMTFLLTICMLLLARARAGGERTYFLLASVTAGLAVLSKSPAVVVWGVMATLFLFPGASWRPKLGTFAVGLGLFLITMAPYPISRMLLAPENAYSMVLWQFNRAPNHAPDYFARVLLQYGGWLVAGLLLLGAWRALRRRSESDKLILAWLLVFMGFHQLWPTKLFSYMMVVVPPLAVLVASGFRDATEWISKLGERAGLGQLPQNLLSAGLLLLLMLPMARSSLALALEGPDATLGDDFDIEVQSFAGGREFGHWAGENTPPNARFLTIGPSLGNILRYYGHRDSVALSVSPDPTRRNPAYVPVANPDLALRQMSVQYIVWDAYSADRSAFYHARINRYIDKFNAILVFSAYLDSAGELVTTAGEPPEGAEARILVYDVPGANPRPWVDGNP